MKKYTIALIMLLSFLVSSRFIYEEHYYIRGNRGDFEVSQYKYYQSQHQTRIEKEHDYMMGGIISLSIGLLLIGFNHFTNKKTK